MKHIIKLTLMVGVAAGALMTGSGHRSHAQGTDPNAAPDPYKMQENWAHLADGRKFGQAIKVQVDHSDGKSIWVFDRCASNDCSNSMIPPIQKFDATGKFVRAFGAGMFNFPHGFYVDGEGNVWVSDERAKNGKGAVVVKFSPQGQVLLTLGKPGMPGNALGFFDGPSGVAVAPNGDIYVATATAAPPMTASSNLPRTASSSWHGASTARRPANSTRLTASHSIRPDASTLPTVLTTASRFSSRTASS